MCVMGVDLLLTVIRRQDITRHLHPQNLSQFSVSCLLIKHRDLYKSTQSSEH